MSAAIETYTGRFFNYEKPSAKDVSLEDIAHALANTPRFRAHIPWYSVAEHALLCRRLLKEEGASLEYQLGALHHDSHEAYLGDIPTPLKNLFRGQGNHYDEMVLQVDWAICDAFGLSLSWMRNDSVHWVDQQALAIEARALKHSRGHGPHWNLVDVKRPSWWVAGRPSEDVKRDFILAHGALRDALDSTL